MRGLNSHIGKSKVERAVWLSQINVRQILGVDNFVGFATETTEKSEFSLKELSVLCGKETFSPFF